MKQQARCVPDHCQAAQDDQKAAFHFKVVVPNRARGNPGCEHGCEKDAVRLLLGQFIKPDVSLIVDVVHYFYFTLVASSEVDNFYDESIQADDYRHVQENVPMKKCGHEDDAEEWSTDK